jgi:ElaA protein
MKALQWQIKKFEELAPHELYAIMKLRSEVFVLEQNCIYLDADDKDQMSWHLMGWDDAHQLMAYCRIIPPGISYAECSIGRVVTHADVRKEGAGKELMKKAIDECGKLFSGQSIKIGAQLYLLKFYSSLGFLQTSEMYLEDGIEHIEMLLDVKNNK